MYKQYYGLQRNPFELTPDSEVLFLSETHKEGLATLKYGILSNKGFLLLTGGVGTGKTTLINVLIKSLKSTVKVCLLSNPILAASEFLYFLSAKLELPAFESKVRFLQDFSAMLEKCYENEEKILLIIDEAHVLPVELLEEIRLLSNLSGDGHNVLSIFLIGQPELLERLADERLLPLRQRIGIRFHLDAFAAEDTVQYIHFRLNRAGAVNSGLFSEEAARLIHLTTHGNPRLINILCDHALLSGFAQEKLTVDTGIIIECVNDLHLPGEAATFDLAPLSQKKDYRKEALLFIIVLSLSVIAALFVFPKQSGFPHFWEWVKTLFYIN
jgi:general secretion pathway protein A